MKPKVGLLVLMLMPVTASLGQSRSMAVSAPRRLVWNQRVGKSLFVEEVSQRIGCDDNDLIYKDSGLEVSLLQPLMFSEKGGYFVWWLTLSDQPGQRMIWFAREGSNRYQAAAIGAELDDLGDLKLVKTKSGASLIFALAGDKQLHLVSVTNPSGQRLLIDYRASGAIESVRDSLSREATPEYVGGHMSTLFQTWFENGNRALTMLRFN